MAQPPSESCPSEQLPNNDLSPEQRSPGRPVNFLLKDTILTAISTVFVEEGYQGLTIGKVAKRAGVSSASIYRRWRTKQNMFHDSICEWKTAITPTINTGRFIGDIDCLIETRAYFLSTPAGQAYGTLLGEASRNPKLGALLREISIDPARLQMQHFLNRARARQEEVFCCPANTVLDMLLSTIHFRAMNALQDPGTEAKVTITDLKELIRCLIPGFRGKSGT